MIIVCSSVDLIELFFYSAPLIYCCEICRFQHTHMMIPMRKPLRRSGMSGILLKAPAIVILVLCGGGRAPNAQILPRILTESLVIIK